MSTHYHNRTSYVAPESYVRTIEWFRDNAHLYQSDKYHI